MASQKEIENEIAELRHQLKTERELTETTTAQWQAAIDEARAEARAFQEAAQKREAALKAACPPPESGFSLNVSFTGKVINGGQVTFRTPQVSEWRMAFNAFAEMVKERDWHFASAPEKPPERTQATEPVKANGEKPTSLQVATPAQTQMTHTFPAGTLAATIADGKTYWKVKGGRFGKWGVTVWPEILDAAGFGALAASQSYDLNGWTAEYVEKEGKPEKIVKLYKQAA